jgi:nitrogen fixation/metabolism regulation signal transduction histidine kinase
MTFKRLQWSFALRVSLLIATLLALCYFLVNGQWWAGACVLPLCIAASLYFFRYHRRIRQEMEQYVLAIHYRDFTRNYSWKNAPVEFRALHKGFNALNDAFRTISRERETQYQYLKKILELVDTGILSFEIETGDVLWMNESLKQLLDIPYLKNIDRADKRNPGLTERLRALQAGESRVISMKRENSAVKVLVTATAFQTEGRVYKLVAFQNINEALDETEAMAWQKLLSVMTHEIMNSVAPIASLADTLKNRMREATERPDKGILLADLELGIETIKRRSEGLTKFAETYRNLSRIKRLELKRVLVRDLFENIYQLMEPTLAQKGIAIEVVPGDTSQALDADPSLTERVLTNLVLNAMEALREKPDPAYNGA